MKKSLLALAALTAFAGVASAQSSVTLFGVVDMSVRSVDNDNGSRTSMANDANASNRLGFRGVEDLGGGLRAGFWIEGGMSPDNGTAGGQTWQRRSTVSLMGGFGELRLGRDYTPTFWNHTVFDPFGTNGVGSQTNLQTTAGSGATSLVRANNTVGYFLPAMGGLYGQVQVSLDEGEHPANDYGYMGGRIGYAAGPVNVAVAYGVTKVQGGTDLEAFNIGGSFNAGFATIMGQYFQYEFGSAKATNYLIGANIPMGAGTFKVSYNVADDFREATQIAVGYVYDLSKRTAVYAHYSMVDNESGAGFTAGAGGKSRGAVTGFSSTGMEFGIRHSF